MRFLSRAQRKMRQDFGLIFWLHLAAIIGIWASPFILSWKLIVVGIFLYYLQLLIIGDCILTRQQFLSAKREVTFYSYYLEKFGIRFERREVRIVADYIMPPVILGIALMWQIKLGNQLISF